MSKKGLFITFEGGDGTGKTTQIKMLNQYIKSKGIETHLTREPGGCPVSERMREIVLTSEVEDLDPISELFLFSASRHEHIRQVIKPKLEQGIFVLSDRFYHTTYAFQGYAGGLDMDIIKKVTDIAVETTRPDLTILLDMDHKLGIERSKGKSLLEFVGGKEELRFESKELEFHKTARQGFLKAVEGDDKAVVISAEQSIEDVHQEIIKALEDRKII